MLLRLGRELRDANRAQLFEDGKELLGALDELGEVDLATAILVESAQQLLLALPRPVDAASCSIASSSSTEMMPSLSVSAAATSSASPGFTFLEAPAPISFALGGALQEGAATRQYNARLRGEAVS